MSTRAILADTMMAGIKAVLPDAQTSMRSVFHTCHLLRTSSYLSQAAYPAKLEKGTEVYTEIWTALLGSSFVRT